MFDRYFDINFQGPDVVFKDSTYGHTCKRCGVTLWGNKNIIRHMREHALAFYRTIKEVIPPEGWDCKIFIGGCIARGIGSSFRHTAHAHNNEWGPKVGGHREACQFYKWICIRGIKRLGEYEITTNPDGSTVVKVIKPSHTLKHEYAHILVPNQGHTETWANRLKELGANTGEYKRRYAWGNKYSTKTGKKFKNLPKPGRIVVRDGVRVR